MYYRTCWGFKFSFSFLLELQLDLQLSQPNCLLSLKWHSHLTAFQIQTLLLFLLTLLSDQFCSPPYALAPPFSKPFSTSWFNSLNRKSSSTIPVINFLLLQWFKSVDLTVMKTRDNRGREFTGGHKEALQSHASSVFFLVAFQQHSSV